MLSRFSTNLLHGAIIAALLFLLATLLCPPAYAEENEAECWAVIIGISDYKRIDDLDYSDDGAKELFRLLSPAWGEGHIKLVLDREATKTEVRLATEWLASQEDENDTVLFFFSGHSDPEGYMAPYDAYYTETWISANELSYWLRPLDSKRIVIILDTCHAGRFENKLSDDGRVILMSSRSNEVSWETSLLENSVFSYYLLEALSEFGLADINLNYELSAEELFQYAEPETTAETIDFEETQHPVLSDQYPGELSLLLKFVLNVAPDLPSGFPILTLDDETYSSVPLELTLAPESVHNLTLLSPLDIGGGTRYIFSSWDDKSTSASRTISGGGVYTANYETQYEMVIESAFGQPEGQGWYEAGSTAVLSAQSIEEPTIRHIFTGWSGDYSSAAITASLTMDSPKKITTNWRTDYLLTIESAYGQPEGEGWYEASSTATISVAPSTGLGIRHIFTGWSGGYSSAATTASLTMDSPKTITANWRNDYTQLYIFIGVAVAIVIAIVLIRMRRKVS